MNLFCNKNRPNDESFFGQVCSLLASFFFGVLVDLDFISIHKHAKKEELGQYPAILNEQAWSITHIYFFSLPYTCFYALSNNPCLVKLDQLFQIVLGIIVWIVYLSLREPITDLHRSDSCRLPAFFSSTNDEFANSNFNC